jgi:hypothetical protein
VEKKLFSEFDNKIFSTKNVRSDFSCKFKQPQKTDSIFHKRAGDMTEGEKYFFIEISAEK